MRKAPTAVVLCLRILFRKHLESKEAQPVLVAPSTTVQDDQEIETILLSDEGLPSVKNIPGFDAAGAWKGSLTALFTLSS